MLNIAFTQAAAAERDLALGYAPASARAGLRALFALDERLGTILRTTREPMVGQMRLTWWHEALTALDHDAPPAEPVLAAITAAVLPRGITGGDLARMIDAWELLLDEPTPGGATLARYAADRGAVLFAAAARVAGGSDPRIESIGEGWALADLAGHVSDAGSADRASALAAEHLAIVRGGRWAGAIRPLAAIALLARSDLAGGVPGSPGRIARLLTMRLTGY